MAAPEGKIQVFFELAVAETGDANIVGVFEGFGGQLVKDFLGAAERHRIGEGTNCVIVGRDDAGSIAFG